MKIKEEEKVEKRVIPEIVLGEVPGRLEIRLSFRDLTTFPSVSLFFQGFRRPSGTKIGRDTFVKVCLSRPLLRHP